MTPDLIRLQLLLAVFAGWVNRQQAQVIGYLTEENRGQTWLHPLHAEGREEDFKRMVAKHSDVGVAIDNNCAIDLVDDGYRVITSQPEAKAYKVFKKDGKVVTEQIAEKQSFTPISTLVN